ALGQPRLTKPTLGFLVGAWGTDMGYRWVRSGTRMRRRARPRGQDAIGAGGPRIIAPALDCSGLQAACQLNGIAMDHRVDIETTHGPIGGWRCDPTGPSRGAVIVIHEIFGLNAHIRSVAGRFAAAGFVAVAPALFDPVSRDVKLDYDAAGVARGRALTAELGFDRAVDLLAAAARTVQAEGLRTAAVGFCWGGTLALLGNTRLGLPAVSYYGGRSVPFLDEPLRAP